MLAKCRDSWTSWLPRGCRTVEIHRHRHWTRFHQYDRGVVSLTGTAGELWSVRDHSHPETARNFGVFDGFVIHAPWAWRLAWSTAGSEQANLRWPSHRSWVGGFDGLCTFHRPLRTSAYFFLDAARVHGLASTDQRLPWDVGRCLRDTFPFLILTKGALADRGSLFTDTAHRPTKGARQ